MRKNIRDVLGKEVLIMDGACGTMLQANYGLKPGEKPELWCIDRPEDILSLHMQYLDAGSDIILTNTFGANSLKLGDKAQEVIEKAIALAKTAVSQKGHGYVAFDIGPTGKVMFPFGDLQFESAYNVFKEMVDCAKSADLIFIETMTDLYELKAAILAAKENSKLPIIASVTLDAFGKTLTGADIETVACYIEGLGVDAIGLNCGFGPQKIAEWIPELSSYVDIPIVIKPNAGMPYIVNEEIRYDSDKHQFAEGIEFALGHGAAVIGGCCGTTPEYIKLIAKNKGRQLSSSNKVSLPKICSYSKTLSLGKEHIIIGERINPTGKSLLKDALLKKDVEYVKREAFNQVEAGAHVLDVNVGLPGINEIQVLSDLIVNLQSFTQIPLQIDTANMQAMDMGLRVYNGIPLINSVNGKMESMREVFPLMKKYGGIAIALMLDEKGISDSVEGRIAVAKKIIREAQKVGLSKERFLFDPLALTIGTGSQNAKQVLEIIKICDTQLKVMTVLGVSNISYGLPNRSLINSVFYSSLLSSGLSAGIIDPNDPKMMGTYYAHMTLSGKDEKLAHYLKKYGKDTNESISEDLSLSKAVIMGLSKDAVLLTEKALEEGLSPFSVIDDILIPTLDEIGKKFEKGEIFLPQLLASADSAKEAFALLRGKITESGSKSARSETIILATVEGDIHDIGKNIVKVVLENYGYNIIDLGRDVKKERILEAINDSNAKLVGLSALMTTTVSNMETTIVYLKENTSVSIMVGGAVLTKEYAKKIGAHFYAKDAMVSIKIADYVFGHATSYE